MSYKSNLNIASKNDVMVDKGGRSTAYFCRNYPVQVDQKTISQLKETFNKSNEISIRLCLHKNPQCLSHEMIVLIRSGEYYRPHKHLSKMDTMLIIEGELAVFTFDNDGGIIDYCRLMPGLSIIYKTAMNVYHAAYPISNTAIYFESREGPFTEAGDSVFAPWSPQPEDTKGINQYHNRLKMTLDQTIR